jgi:ankyrin repeat protein
LDETYERVLKEIGKTNECYARRLLQCLTVAMRPLEVAELAEILALDFGAEEGIPVLKENWRWKDQQEAVLSTCSSLIVVVDDKSIRRRLVQFSHFSVKEFLTSDRLATSSADISPFHILSRPAHAAIVKACLGILLQSEQSPLDATDECLYPPKSPLFYYAARHWIDHARFDELWRLVEHGIRRLFDLEKPHLERWLKFWYDIGFFPGFNLGKYRGSPLYYASLCGLRGLAAQLIAENPQYVTGQVGRNPTPLVAALHCRHFDIADLLYQAGADLCIRGDGDMTLLHAASSKGSVDIANWLFNHGVSAKNAHNGHPRNIINVNALDGDDNTPLQLASKGGHSEIVKQLLMHGADINVQDWSHTTALHLASESDHFWASAKLRPSQLNIKANINGQDIFMGDHPTSNRRSDTVQILINHGVDVAALDMTQQTPLHIASSSGGVEIARLLIKHGADVNVKNEIDATSLHLASSSEESSVVHLLVEHGADVTAKDWSHKTPLHLVSSWVTAKPASLSFQLG